METAKRRKFIEMNKMRERASLEFCSLMPRLKRWCCRFVKLFETEWTGNYSTWNFGITVFRVEFFLSVIPNFGWIQMLFRSGSIQFRFLFDPQLEFGFVISSFFLISRMHNLALFLFRHRRRCLHAHLMGTKDTCEWGRCLPIHNRFKYQCQEHESTNFVMWPY